MTSLPLVDLNTIHVPATSGVPPAAWYEQIRSNFEALLGVPAVEMARFSIPIPTNTTTAIGFPGGAAIDTDDMHDPVTNNDRVTAKTAGLYLVVASLVFPTETGWSLVLSKNGVQVFRVNQPTISGYRTGVNIVRLVSLGVGDYVNVSALQFSGSSKTTGVRLAAWRVGPASPSAAFSYADLSTIHGPAVGATAPAAWGTGVRTDFEAIRNRPVCVLEKSGAQSIPNNTVTNLTWNTEVSDAWGFHTGSSDIVVPTVRGLYMVFANITFATSGVGVRLISINPFNTEIIRADGVTGLNSCLIRRLNTGFPLHVAAYQTSGGPLNVTADAQFGFVWLGE
jgi:hypothetical protein